VLADVEDFSLIITFFIDSFTDWAAHRISDRASLSADVESPS
jgi:hypothetical protein